jgi:hypothetical protein
MDCVGGYMSITTINNTTYKSENTFSVVEIGDSKQQEFYPQVKIMRWDNESNFSIRLSSDLGTQEIIDDKISWASSDLSSLFYEKPVDDQNEFGAFEFEVILQKPPKSNVLEFTLEYKELVAYYQPALTQEQVDLRYNNYLAVCSGNDTTPLYTKEEYRYQIRPENIVGSYAFYHTHKTNNQYTTGKAFHIYRPYAIDNKGDKIWCGLFIDLDKKIATITIPQKWIDTAEYPITIDPTIGNTHAGTSYESMGTDYCYLSKDSADDYYSCDSFYAYVKGNTGCYYKGIIGDNGGELVTNSITNGVSVPTSTAAWKYFNYVSKPLLVSGCNYWLAAIDNGGYLSVAYDTGSSETGGYDYNNYTSPTDMYFNYWGDTTELMSIYCNTTTVSASGIPLDKAFYMIDGSYTTTISGDNFNDSSLAAFWTDDHSGFSYSITESTTVSLYARTTTTNGNSAWQYIYQPTSSGFDISVKLNSHTVTNPTRGYSIGYLGLELSVGFFQLGVRSNMSSSQSVFYFRPTIGDDVIVTDAYFPIWLRIIATNYIISAYISSNGSTWTEVCNYIMGNKTISRILLASNSRTSTAGYYVGATTVFDDFTATGRPVVTKCNMYGSSDGMPDYLNTYTDRVGYIPIVSGAGTGDHPTDLRIRKGGTTYTVQSEL